MAHIFGGLGKPIGDYDVKYEKHEDMIHLKIYRNDSLLITHVFSADSEPFDVKNIFRFGKVKIKINNESRGKPAINVRCHEYGQKSEIVFQFATGK